MLAGGMRGGNQRPGGEGNEEETRPDYLVEDEETWTPDDGRSVPRNIEYPSSGPALKIVDGPREKLTSRGPCFEIKKRSRKLKLRRALHLVGAGTLTEPCSSEPLRAATADSIRDRQWPLAAFGVRKSGRSRLVKASR